jgi:hypothetical protein
MSQYSNTHGTQNVVRALPVLLQFVVDQAAVQYKEKSMPSMVIAPTTQLCHYSTKVVMMDKEMSMALFQ